MRARCGVACVLRALFLLRFARVSFLRRKTNITQAPCQDRVSTVGSTYSGRDDSTRAAEQENHRVYDSARAAKRHTQMRATVPSAQRSRRQGLLPPHVSVAALAVLDENIKARLKAHLYTHVFILRNEPRQYFTLRWGICSIHRAAFFGKSSLLENKPTASYLRTRHGKVT